MADVQKLCGIRLGRKDARIKINLARKLRDGESVAFQLWLTDPSRNENLVAIAGGSLGKDGQSLDLAVQNSNAGLFIAYTTDGFAKLKLLWKESLQDSIDGTAQFSLDGSAYVFPAMSFVLHPPPPPIPAPPLPPPPPPPP